MMKLISVIVLTALTLVSYSQKYQETRRFDAPTSVKIDGKMLVKFHKAEDVEVVIETEKVDLKDIYTKYSGDELLVRVEPLDIEGGKVTVDLYLPPFATIEISRGAAARIQKELLLQNFEASVSSGATLNLHLDSEHMSAKVASGGFLELFGNLNHLEAKVITGGKLRTDSLTLQTAKLKTRSGGFIAANPKENAELRATFGGEIKLLEPVKTKNVSTFFKGEIIEADLN
ncbi:MAG: DUF2807 domain-containing protein [Salinivirgaceae bacterium]